MAIRKQIITRIHPYDANLVPSIIILIIKMVVAYTFSFVVFLIVANNVNGNSNIVNPLT